MVQSYRMPDHFRLEHVQDEFNFATDEELEKSRRFRMIVLRDQDVPYFRNQRIPLSDKDVPEELFAVSVIFNFCNCIISTVSYITHIIIW